MLMLALTQCTLLAKYDNLKLLVHSNKQGQKHRTVQNN